MKKPKEGDLRVLNIINPPLQGLRYPVANPEEAIKLIDLLANAQLEIKWITDNVFRLEVFEDGKWIERIKPKGCPCKKSKQCPYYTRLLKEKE